MATGEAEDQSIGQYYENVLAGLIDGIVVVGLDLRIMTFSVIAEQMTGLKAQAVEGKRLDHVFGEGSQVSSLAEKTLRTGRSYIDLNFTLRRIFGERRDLGLATSSLLDESGQKNGVVIVFRNLSRVKALEDRLRKGERLASIGVLAAGMAHEIKNPLGGIRGASQLLAGELEARSSLKEYTDIIIREVDRLNNIVQSLLDYSKPPQLNLCPVNVHQIIDGVIDLVNLGGRAQGLQINRRYDPSLPEVLGDPDQLAQVFLNLFYNGIDAMKGSGTLTLTTRILPGYRVENATGEKRQMIAVDIADQGKGMTSEEVERIFDPFFSTKATGVGLGLAVCHRIVEEHGGKIDVESHVGSGTTFRVSLLMATSSSGRQASKPA
ncbi:MAG: ATP-binding protein [bacterium]|nr:ATP-binding protein [bacterium]